MISNDHRFNRQQLLAVESACDQFEDDLAQGNARPLDCYVQNLEPDLQVTALEELKRVQREWQQSVTPNRNSDTLNEPRLPTLATWLKPATKVLSTCDQSTPDRLRGTDHDFDLAFSLPGFTVEREGETPARLGKYHLLQRLGVGSSGVVWRALDTILQREVALKLTRCETVRDASRFMRETVAATRLDHPGIVRVYDAGRIGPFFFIASQWIKGPTLAEYLQEQPLSCEQAVQITIQLAQALQHSHEREIIHRDLKPHNVLMQDARTVLLTDFDLARHLQQDQSLTRSGDLIGTPAYMSPEQAEGESRRCGPPTDIYSLGVILYQMLTNRLPFQGSVEQILTQIVRSVPPSVQRIRPDIPKSLAKICDRCLEKDPADRYPTAWELAQDLQRFQQGQPVAIPPVTRWRRCRQWMQRHPQSVAAWLATAAFVVTLVAAVVWSGIQGSAWNSIHAEHQQQAKQWESSLEQSRQNLNQSENLNQSLIRLLPMAFAPADLISIQYQPGQTTQVSSLWNRQTLQSFDDAIERFLDDPEQKQAATVALAEQYRRQGWLAEAESILSRHLPALSKSTGRQSLLNPEPTTSVPFCILAAHLNYDQGKFEAALNWLNFAWQQQQARSAFRETDQVRNDLLTAQIQFARACVHLRLKQNTDAEPLLLQALNVRRRHLPSDDPLLVTTELAALQCQSEEAALPDAAELLQRLPQDRVGQAISLYWQIQQLRSQRQLDQAILKYHELLELVLSQVGSDSSLYILAQGDLAGLMLDNGQYCDAEPLVLRALEKSRQIAAGHPQRVSAILRFSDELLLAQRYEECAQWLYELETLEEQGYQAAVRSRTTRIATLAECLLLDHKPRQALVYSQQLVQPNQGFTGEMKAWFAFLHSQVLLMLEDAESKQYQQHALTVIEQLKVQNKFTTHIRWRSRIGEILLTFGQPDEAATHFRYALEAAQKQYVDDHPRIAGQMHWLAESLGATPEARNWREKSQQIYHRRLPPNDARIFPVSN